jgi:ribosomal protein S21
MPLEVKRKERESAQSLIRRFSKRLKKSGILIRARKKKFFERKKSKQMKKRAALRREEIKREHERAEKLGQKIR